MIFFKIFFIVLVYYIIGRFVFVQSMDRRPIDFGDYFGLIMFPAVVIITLIIWIKRKF